MNVKASKVVCSVPGFVLVKTASTPRREAPVSERAATLVPRLARALSRPGISKEAVFKGRTHNVYSYSIDPSDIARVIRVSADGRRTVGRLVGKRFVRKRSINPALVPHGKTV
jgi:hypothetical protein